MVPFDDQSAEVGAEDVLPMKQSGFITLPFTAWIAIGASVAILGLSVAVKVQSSRLASCKQEYADFKADVKAKGEAAIENARKIDQENAKRKEKSDAERKRLIIANNGLADRLRDNAARSSLPETAGNTGIPETACFKRADLDAAIRGFTLSVSGIVTQGDAAVTDLDNAKQWAQN